MNSAAANYIAFRMITLGGGEWCWNHPAGCSLWPAILAFAAVTVVIILTVGVVWSVVTNPGEDE